MTDKQLERGNQIKTEMAELEKLTTVSCSYSHPGEVDIFGHTMFEDFAKIEQRLNKRWQELVQVKLTALKKEFAKL